MPVDAGPFTIWDPASIDFTPMEPALAALVAELDEQLAAIDSDLVEPEMSAGEALTDDWLLPVDAAILEAAEGLETDQEVADLAELQSAELAGAEMDDLVTAAYAELPSEAWQEVPAPYTPPAEVGGFTVDEQFGTTIPAGTGAGAGAIAPYYGPGRDWIINLSRPDSAEFYVGDRWRIIAAGRPGAGVWLHAWQNGTDLGTATLGSTNEYGNFVLEGSMGPETVGDWQEEWYVGDEQLQPILTFNVYPAESAPEE